MTERVRLEDLNDIPTHYADLVVPLAAEPPPAEPDPEDPDAPAPIEGGQTHAEILGLQLPEEHHLVTGLIPDGSVGTIAGLPETHKSFLAQSVAVRVAGGTGTILGHAVARSVNVAYLWQDDSTRSEIERIQLYETVHATEPNLPLRWYLNLGVSLPRDIDRLRATVDKHEIGLLILDSFYNFAALDLKDSDAELLVALLKHRISDPTGATVIIVDHMPWPTDANRQRLRSYGGVFKSAATRFGIYLDVNQKKIWVEARGNNIEGFERTLAEWDKESLEIRLVETAVEDEEDTADYEQKILDYLADKPNSPTAHLDQLKGRKTRLLEARKTLLEKGRITRTKQGSRLLWSITAPSLLDTGFPELDGNLGTNPLETGLLNGKAGSGTSAEPTYRNEPNTSEVPTEVPTNVGTSSPGTSGTSDSSTSSGNLENEPNPLS